MGGEGMTRRSIGSLMRKKLSDITNSQPQPKLPIQEEMPLETFSAEKDYIEQLLKEKMTLIQLLAERNKIIELSGAELQRLRSNIQKLQLQNLNLAQSNSQMLAELNLGRERMKALQHDILCKAALLKGKNLGVEGKVDMNYENNGSVLQEEEEKAGRPSVKACNQNRTRTIRRSQSLGSSTKDGSKEKDKHKRQCLRRHSTAVRLRRHEHEPLENLFEIEDAKYPINHSGHDSLSSPAVKDETGENSALRNDAPRSSFGRPLRKAAADKVHSYKERSLKAKLRRLD
ncbi:hypothetical protein L6164_022028 [Bauhinia variegata]|uniref:Uncharacterized protein n=1 Tax=Bauhinia variegata TaxID=167791 RepID=A0ACB9MF99_BAUVA|nr:hypothetical protein L6164_022028 [Bauhinia variegata]